ncbi:MAG TPA: TPM domain-containing protein [Gemmatimonadales bacterium]|nr:TPM domain-containing protein [Gemmatimonadales bacterium]
MIATRAKATALLVALQLTAATSWAQRPGVDTLFPPQPVGYVSDLASVIDAGSEAGIEDLIQRLRAATGAEIAVATLPSIGEQDPAEVALAIGRKWKVGAKAEVGDARRNAGIVVLLVPRQAGQPGSGHIRIEVGQGLEGIIPDAAAGRIRRQVMGPDLEREAYGPALLKGVQVLASEIARGYGVSDSALTAYRAPESPGSGARTLSNFLPIALFIVFLLLSARGSSGRRRRRNVYWGGGPWIGGGWGGGGGFGGGGGGFGGFGGGGGFSGGGAGGRF